MNTLVAQIAVMAAVCALVLGARAEGMYWDMEWVFSPRIPIPGAPC